MVNGYGEPWANSILYAREAGRVELTKAEADILEANIQNYEFCGDKLNTAEIFGTYFGNRVTLLRAAAEPQAAAEPEPEPPAAQPEPETEPEPPAAGNFPAFLDIYILKKKLIFYI